MAVYYAGFIPADGVYAVLFPDLPGCNTEGATMEGAFAMAIEAVSGHLEAMAGKAAGAICGAWLRRVARRHGAASGAVAQSGHAYQAGGYLAQSVQAGHD